MNNCPSSFFFFFFLLLCQVYGFYFCAAARSRLQARGKKFRDGIFSVGVREREERKSFYLVHTFLQKTIVFSYDDEARNSGHRYASSNPRQVPALVMVDPRTDTHGSLAPLVKSFAWRGRHSNAKEPLWPSACKRAGGRVFISSSRR